MSRIIINPRRMPKRRAGKSKRFTTHDGAPIRIKVTKSRKGCGPVQSICIVCHEAPALTGQRLCAVCNEEPAFDIEEDTPL